VPQPVSAVPTLYRGPAGEQLYYDAAELDGFDPASLAVLRDLPIQQTASERLGGSALVVAAAMDAAQYDGRIVCVDPNPNIAPEHWARLEPRATLVRGWSPAAVPVAARAAGGPFDVALTDGHHTTAAV
jgi:hypothetical protein